MSTEEAAKIAQNELNTMLIRRNASRVFLSCVMLAVLIPAYMLITKLTNQFGSNSSGAIIYLVVIEVVQVAFGLISFFLKQADEIDKLPLFNQVYFAVTGLMLIMLARVEFASNGNYLIYVLTTGYLSLVPIWKTKQRRLNTIPTLVITWITAASAGAGIEKFVLVAIIALFALPVSLYAQNNAIDHERMIIRLKEKTRTSESDPLTKLTNRRGLDRKASVLWPYCSRTGSSVGVIELDIDYFKKYNDKFGHPAGDKCIKRVASAIRSAVKRSCDITARIGGEEFMVFVQDVNEQELIALAMKIRSTVEAMKIPHACVTVSKYVTVSMGAAIMVPDTTNCFDDLYAAADKALYIAKENGRNCIVYGNKIYGKMRGGLSMRIPS